MSQHEAFLIGIHTLFTTLIEMGHLPTRVVSYPPHESLVVGHLCTAELELEVIDLILRMPMLSEDLYDGDSTFGDGVELAPSSSALSYLSDRSVEIAQKSDCIGHEILPSWYVRVLRSGRDVGVSVAYDAKNGVVVEWRRDEDWKSAQRMSVKEYFEDWIDKFRSLEWLPWHDSFGYNVFERPQGHERYLADPGLARKKIGLERTGLLSIPGATVPSIDQMIMNRAEVLKAEHNCFWSKRRLFEETGWGHDFDVERFRGSREEYERQFKEVTSLARGGPKGQSLYNIEHGGQLREWYRAKAGPYGL